MHYGMQITNSLRGSFENTRVRECNAETEKKKKKAKKNTIKKKKKVPLFTNLRVVRALQPLLVSWRRTLLTPGVTGVLGHTLSL